MMDAEQLLSLELACADGPIDRVKKLLSEFEALPEDELRDAFHAAVQHDQSSIVALLSSRGVHYNLADFEVAVRHKNIATLQAFFDHHRGCINKIFPESGLSPLTSVIPV